MFQKARNISESPVTLLSMHPDAMEGKKIPGTKYANAWFMRDRTHYSIYFSVCDAQWFLGFWRSRECSSLCSQVPGIEQVAAHLYSRTRGPHTPLWF